MKEKALAKPTSCDQRERRFEIGVGFAGKADDEIGGEGNIRPHSADLRDAGKIIGSAMIAIHRFEDAVGTRLHRQMQIGHDAGYVASGRQQIRAHVVWVARCVAQPRDALDCRDPAQKFAKGNDGAAFIAAMIGIHVLAEQRHFAHPGAARCSTSAATLATAARPLRRAYREPHRKCRICRILPEP